MEISIKEAKKLSQYGNNNSLADKVIMAILDNKKSLELNQYEYQLAVNRYNQSYQEELALKACVKLNNKGIKLEKEGKAKQAIRLYETNILNGFPAHHSYKRLMVLYHKVKDYDNEKRVIERALYVFPNFQEYVDRLAKINILIEKRVQ